MKFREDRCKGEAVMHMKPFYLTMRLQTDRRTDRHTDSRTDRVITVYPPNFVAGGIISRVSTLSTDMYFLNRKSHHHHFCTRVTGTNMCSTIPLMVKCDYHQSLNTYKFDKQTD